MREEEEKIERRLGRERGCGDEKKTRKRKRSTREWRTNEREEATAEEETTQVRGIRSIVTNSVNLLKRRSPPRAR